MICCLTLLCSHFLQCLFNIATYMKFKISIHVFEFFFDRSKSYFKKMSGPDTWPKQGKILCTRPGATICRPKHGQMASPNQAWQFLHLQTIKTRLNESNSPVGHDAERIQHLPTYTPISCDPILHAHASLIIPWRWWCSTSPQHNASTRRNIFGD